MTAPDEPQRDPADIPLVTFDNNVLIAVRRDEASAPAVRDLLAMNRAGLIIVNVTMHTAMEAQRDGEQMEWADHVAWLASLGIAREHIFTHPRSIGFRVPGMPDGPTFDPRLEQAFADRLHSILFPNMPRMWWEYRRQECERRHLTDAEYQAVLELDDQRYGPIRIPPRPTPALDALTNERRKELASLLTDLNRRWFNASNDAGGLLIHISLVGYTRHPEQAVFVTSDTNFTKQSRLAQFRALNVPGHILPSAEAVSFLRGITGTSK